MTQREDWERVYLNNRPDKLGWYKPHLETSFKWIKELELSEDSNIIDVGGGASTLVDDLLNGRCIGEISHRFHTTLVFLFSDLCHTIREETGIDRVVLSGGVFQNAFMLKELDNALSNRNFRVYSHTTVPCNDGGISLGQAAVAAARFTLREACHVSGSSHEDFAN